ncbi:hypothetical protein [Desulfatibacillum aliphaticivorans]|uniref:DUF4064 domain-containing protein n=1 Tax=Desulfatibacillum aliphaticivorans TaxID=218208 RepID=B8FB67_DESAL|nr:hypothetical protein [Desulfatibacillum aliphaticivorans]ACL04511.1 hypothetical protein Dalk_2820 [Desulfatibacillum aliphaticivorans]
MDRPGWATAVGIVGIILAIFSILGTVQLAFIPLFQELGDKMAEDFQKEFPQQMERMQEQGGMPAYTERQMKQMENMFKSMRKIPDWFLSFLTAAYILEALVSIGVIIGCINILRMKKSGVPLFLWTAGFKAAISLSVLIAAFFASSLFAWTMVGGSGIGFVAISGLIVIAALGNKGVFRAKPPKIPNGPPWDSNR